MNERRRHWAEIGAFFAGALLGGGLMAEVMKADLPPPEAHRYQGPAAPVQAEVHVWGDVKPEHIPEAGMRGMVLLFDSDIDMSRASGSGIWLRPGPMETRQR